MGNDGLQEPSPLFATVSMLANDHPNRVVPGTSHAEILSRKAHLPPRLREWLGWIVQGIRSFEESPIDPWRYRRHGSILAQVN
jgi:hypothetical protein